MRSGARVADAIILLCLCVAVQAMPCRADSEASTKPEETYTDPPQSISLQDFPGRLIRLHSLIDDCMQKMTAASCDWKLVGPDAAVQTTSGIRTVQFAWLRSVLKNASAAAGKQAALKAASNGLREAALQLDQDLARQQETHQNLRDVSAERASLKNIFATGGYAQEVPPTLLERLRDAFLQWLESRLNAIGASQGSQLLVTLLLVTLIAVTCGAMIWWLTRKVSSQRLMLTSTRSAHPSAPSAQDWEKWLNQGKSLARQQQWREAVHEVYWSAISCLESRGLWPADRARTPREYLGLLAGRPETRADLSTLTRSFERIWYGNQAAGQPEFEHACALLERLAR